MTSESVMTSKPIGLQFSDSPCVITMYGHAICKPQITYFKKNIILLEKYQVKSVLHEQIRNTALRLCNRNDACRNTKHEVSIDSVTAKNGQSITTAKLSLTCHSMNNQSRRDAVTRENDTWFLRTGAYIQIRLRPNHKAHSPSCYNITVASLKLTSIQVSTILVCRGVSWLS